MDMISTKFKPITLLQDRYSSYKSGIGAKIEEGNTSLEELEVTFLTIFYMNVKFLYEMAHFVIFCSTEYGC